MRWSKLKEKVQSNFADSIKNRISINSTRYGNCGCGHAWITLDKTVIANYCTRAYWDKKHKLERGIAKFEDFENRDKALYSEWGEMSRQDAYNSCWDFVHSLTIEQALKDDDPLIQTLAVLDSRLGKRRLARIDSKKLHKLARKLYEIRIDAENV